MKECCGVVLFSTAGEEERESDCTEKSEKQRMNSFHGSKHNKREGSEPKWRTWRSLKKEIDVVKHAKFKIKLEKEKGVTAFEE